MLQVSEALIFSKEDGHELQIGIFVDLGENHTSGEFQLNENEEPNARLISVIGSSHQQDGVPEIGEICPDFSSAAYRLGIATADATKSGYSSENEDFSLPDSVEEVAEHMLKKLKSSGPFAPDELKPLTF
jgi:hypothetical protein